MATSYVDRVKGQLDRVKGQQREYVAVSSTTHFLPVPPAKKRKTYHHSATEEGLKEDLIVHGVSPTTLVSPLKENETLGQNLANRVPTPPLCHPNDTSSPTFQVEATVETVHILDQLFAELATVNARHYLRMVINAATGYMKRYKCTSFDAFQVDSQIWEDLQGKRDEINLVFHENSENYSSDQEFFFDQQNCLKSIISKSFDLTPQKKRALIQIVNVIAASKE